MGQAMEQVGEYGSAVRYHREALALEPTQTFTQHFINNNLGFFSRSAWTGCSLLPLLVAENVPRRSAHRRRRKRR